MWLGDAKQLKTGSKEGGNTEAGRAWTVQSVAGLCCCLRSPTSAILKAVAGVALQLSLVPVALSITVVGMSNYYILKSISNSVWESLCSSGSISSVCCRGHRTLLSSMLVPCLANLRVSTWGAWECSTWSHCCCSDSHECPSVCQA